MFFNHTSNRPDCFHGFKEEEVEAFRLQNLIRENILKVERENMEIIQKKISDKKLLDEKEFNMKKGMKIDFSTTSSKTSVITKPKTVARKIFVPKVTSEKKTSDSQLPNLHAKPKGQSTNPMCQFSNIHFLNHFHSSFLSSKRQTKVPDRTTKYFPCAIPLSPPIQMKDSSLLNEKAQLNGKTAPSSNSVNHHVISGDARDKLTVQVLPSINIIGKKPNHYRNVLVEEVRKRDYFEGDGIQTTILPALSNDERNRISRVNLNAHVPTRSSAMCDKMNQSNISVPKLSSYAQTGDPKIAFDATAEKDHLKSIIQEVLFDIQETNYKTTSIRTVDATTQKDLVTSENDCELDSFLGNADSISKSQLCHQVEKKMSAFTQTSNSVEAFVHSKEQMRDLIQEVISEFQSRFSFCSIAKHLELQKTTEIEKINKGVQTDQRCNNSTPCYVHKAVQVSMKEVNYKCDAAVSPQNFVKDSTDKDHDHVLMNLTEDVVPHAAHDCAIPEVAEKSQKLESVLNVIYERFCVENTGTSLYPNPPLSRVNTHAVTTRDVSVQFNPILTLTKSTCTSSIRRIDVAHQCELLPQVTMADNVVSHAAVQTQQPTLEMKHPVSFSHTCVQCDRPAVMDSYVQTVQPLTSLQPSENSTNTSVSTTPISDSMFVDDMLSEGEVFLPWNLRLLSSSDKMGIQNSRNDTEASGNSDKEKDYSLSEGEIHPNYFLQMNIPQSSSCDSSIDSSLYPRTRSHSYPFLVRKSPGEIYPGTHSCYGDLYLHSSSSASEGEFRNCSTLLSEGEVRLPSSYVRPSSSPSSLQWDSSQMSHSKMDDPSVNHESEFSTNLSQRSYHTFSLSEIKATGEVDEASLSTVTEET